MVVGGGLILCAPQYTERNNRLILEKLGQTLVCGIGLGLAVMVLMIVLVITVVGILLAIPLAIVVLVVSELRYLALGRLVTDNWEIVLLIAMGASAFVGGVPILGGLVELLLASLGIGAAYLDYRSDG